jgi:hypothetical protein
MRLATRMLVRGSRMMIGLLLACLMKGKLDGRTYWLLMGLEYLDQTGLSAYVTLAVDDLAYLVLNKLQIPELVDQERLVRRVEEGSDQHPLESPGDFIVVHQQSSKEQASHQRGALQLKWTDL